MLKDCQPGMDQKVEFWNHARMYEPSRPQDEESSNQTIYALQRIVHHEIVFEIEIYVIITQIIQTRAILQVIAVCTKVGAADFSDIFF